MAETTYSHKHFLPTKLSDDPEVQSSFMFRKSQDLEDKHEQGQNVQKQREDEMVLAWSGLSIYLGRFCYSRVQKCP